MSRFWISRVLPRASPRVMPSIFRLQRPLVSPSMRARIQDSMSHVGGVLKVGAAGLSVLAVCKINNEFRNLEKKYPALPLADESMTLRVPHHPETQSCAYAEVCIAQIPLKVLDEASPQHPLWAQPNRPIVDEVWARTAINEPPKILFFYLSLLTGLKLSPYYKKPALGKHDYWPVMYKGPVVPLNDRRRAWWRHSVQDEWQADIGISNNQLWFKLSLWGIPCRMPSNFRVETGVSRPFTLRGEEYIEVRFAFAADYDLLPSERKVRKHKIAQRWVIAMWRGYLRWHLDCAVRRLLQDHEERRRLGSQ